ncbi:1,6-anhydro-N-acetylmuramyl-L-alanine amidase AmpD [Permianibacter aggregans]|uniref:1,6-anhydro-N-acetylmuramyl-L-alanine amidase AmpD n=1 Tax=Permianibacter aggregans TaxID=1510150 RepID=A0A4R6UHE6_9GAMM|nr:1,6-anhydro-N-acetylmuramyl-L-alanine amidase AmpD [Permianibacter aggregans]QGX39009.1 1,6-anhydro-N-acetylmuramyl-L-alanine amidase AmpD [Permianibacter aggregans]TDQ44653.1 AmpD protein [Permianibacter aggregans]
MSYAPRYPDATFVESPNFDARPDPQDISLLVIHAISLPPESFGGPYVRQLFQGKLDAGAHPYFADIASLQVSAHFFVRRDGAVEQFVDCGMRAWHAGKSSFAGRERCNDFSIGIELEGSDNQPFADAQYSALVALTAWLLQEYPGLSPQRIVGHEHIAPGRKTDPGPYFDWARFRQELSDNRF